MRDYLIDVLPLKIEASQLTESAGKNNGRLIIPNMIIQRANVPNKNRRIYPKRILEREMSSLVESIHKTGARGILGELDHPDSSVINLKNACLGVIDYRWKNNDMLGDVEVLHTPSGNILKEIILAGYVPGISSRGMGSVKNLHEQDDPDLVEVEDDFSLLCWDAVSDPSTHSAYFKEIKEGYNSKIVSKQYSKIDSTIQDIICELSGVCCLKDN